MLETLGLHALFNVAIAVAAAIPLFLLYERRGRPGWTPVEGAPVDIVRGSYRDTTVRPLDLGRAPGAVRVVAFVCLAAVLYAAWALGRASWTARAMGLFGPEQGLALATLVLFPLLAFLASISVLRAGLALLRGDAQASERARGAARAAVVVAVLRLGAGGFAAAVMYFGRANMAVHALIEFALVMAQVSALLYVARRYEAPRTVVREAAADAGLDATAVSSS